MNSIWIDSIPFAFWGIILHWISDWLFQNEWMALNKHEVGYAMLCHGIIHLVMLYTIFPWQIALIITLLHVVIDTRIPLSWWRKTFGQTTDGSMGLHVAIWTDQVLHITIICMMSQFTVRLMQQKLI